MAARGESTQSHVALGELCGHYYDPVMAYLRRAGYDRDGLARDLAHDFLPISCLVVAWSISTRAGKVQVLFTRCIETLSVASPQSAADAEARRACGIGFAQ